MNEYFFSTLFTMPFSIGPSKLYLSEFPFRQSSSYASLPCVYLFLSMLEIVYRKYIYLTRIIPPCQKEPYAVHFFIPNTWHSRWYIIVWLDVDTDDGDECKIHSDNQA